MSVNEYCGVCIVCGERRWDGDEVVDIAGDLVHLHCVSETTCRRCGEDAGEALRAHETDEDVPVCAACRKSLTCAAEGEPHWVGPFAENH